MKRPIVIWPDSILSRRCEAVPAPLASGAAAALGGEDPWHGVRALLNDMEETMHAVRGIGLAAPQVGFSLRLIVVVAKKVGSAEHVVLKLVNPVLLPMRGSAQAAAYTLGDDNTPPTTQSGEGCLSFPGLKANVTRFSHVRVEALDETGARVEIECDGELAACLQHEIEHLDGITLVDHLSVLKRDVLRKQYTRAKKRGLRYKMESPAARDFTQLA
jgi:peptide deformylase